MYVPTSSWCISPISSVFVLGFTLISSRHGFKLLARGSMGNLLLVMWIFPCRVTFRIVVDTDVNYGTVGEASTGIALISIFNILLVSVSGSSYLVNFSETLEEVCFRSESFAMSIIMHHLSFLSLTTISDIVL